MKEQDEVYCDRQLCVDQNYTKDGGCHKCPAGKESMKEQDERYKLAEELTTKFFGILNRSEALACADFILAGRRRCLEKVEKPLLKLTELLIRNGHQQLSDELIMIDDALSIIKNLKG